LFVFRKGRTQNFLKGGKREGKDMLNDFCRRSKGRKKENRFVFWFRKRRKKGARCGSADGPVKP